MRIVQFLASQSSWGDINPETMREKGVGGRETALIQLAEAWADAGHEVINFVPTENTSGEIGKSRYVNAGYAGDYLRNFGADVVVSWEESKVFAGPWVENIKLKIIEMQVAHFETSEEANENIDYYAVLSNWAGNFLLHQSLGIDAKKLVVLPNGVDMSRYSKPKFGYPSKVAKSGEWHFYYSSSPDRGLRELLNMWPRIRDEFPKARLHVAYGIENWFEANMWVHNVQSEAAIDVAEGINQPGILYHGKMGQGDLAKLQQSCHALLYPCNTMSPTETGCITVVEAGAAATPAIITDCDCLGSEFGETAAISKLPFDSEDYCDTISSVLSNPDRYESLQKRGYELASSRSWDLIAANWIDLFEESLNATTV